MAKTPTLGLLAAAAMLALAGPAFAQEAAQTKENWQCKVDIRVLPSIADDAPEEDTVFYTTNTRKQCPGNTSTSGGTAQVTIDCDTPVPNWTGGAENTSGFECTIYRAPCGLPGLLSTDDTSLQVNAQGIAKLRCTCAPTLDSEGNPVCS